ncbi:MAG: RodZ domain-containing protein [Pseudohongiellaceae bacterium]
MSDSVVLESSGDKQLTVGEILAQERQRLALNEKEVADQLHITMHYVKALESNSYEKLPSAVFVKGYIRSYALLLGLNAQEVLSHYDQHTSQQKAVIDEASRAQARRKKDRNRPFVIVSLLIFVGGFLGLWLANSYFGEGATSDLPATTETGTSAESIRPAVSQQAQPQLTLESEPQEILSPSAQPATTVASLTEPTLIQPELSAVDESLITAPAISAADSGDSSPTLMDLAAALQGVELDQQTETAAVPAEVVSSDPQSPRVITIAAIGDDVLRISFTGESWVEVNDSESQQIYRDIREAGDVLEITGSAPFNILLGDAPFTRMSLNGDEIDLSSDIRIDNSARLTVGL